MFSQSYRTLRLAQHVARREAAGQSRLSRLSGIHPKSLSRFLLSGHIPAARLPALETAVRSIYPPSLPDRGTDAFAGNDVGFQLLWHSQPLDQGQLRNILGKISDLRGRRIVLEQDGIHPLFDDRIRLEDDATEAEITRLAPEYAPSLVLAKAGVNLARRRAALRGHEGMDGFNETIEDLMAIVSSTHHRIVIAPDLPALLKHTRSLALHADIGAVLAFETSTALYLLPPNVPMFATVCSAMEKLLDNGQDRHQMIEALRQLLFPNHFW